MTKSQVPRPADTLKPPQAVPPAKPVTPIRGPLTTEIERQRAEGEGMVAPPAETEKKPKRDEGETATTTKV